MDNTNEMERRKEELENKVAIAVLGEQMTATQKTLEKINDSLETLNKDLQNHFIDEVHNAARHAKDLQDIKDEQAKNIEAIKTDVSVMRTDIKELKSGWTMGNKIVVGIGATILFLVQYFRDPILRWLGWN